ncbi:putative ribonuclease H-like domain-containing protein [Tanacetum coccineum]
MTEGNKKQYIADVRVMNYLLQAIPNDIYNSVDACKNAKKMWKRIKRLMHGSVITTHARHSRLMDEFNKFAAKERESLDSVYERLTTRVNIMDRNNVRPITMAINTMFLNCLQPEWVQFEPHVLASRAKKAAKNHDPLALIAHSHASSSHSHANSSYSPQSYYVTHPPYVVDYDDEYQGELQGDSQEHKLTTAMMLLARAISQKFSSPTNNRLRYGGNANKNAGRNRNQLFNAGNGSDESNQIVQRVPRTDSTPRKANVQCYNCNEKGHFARDCQKPKVRDAKYFREQMLLAMKDEAGSHLSNEENDFMLDNAYGEESLDELTASVMLMARLQPADGNTDTVPSYDEKAVSQVHDSSKAYEQMSHVKRKTIIQTTNDDQIDSSIIFDDPYVDNNGGTSKHDSIAHEEYHEMQMLTYNVQREAENKKRLNNDLKKQKDLLQQELETFKDRVKIFESPTVQCSKYKETCDDLERESRNDKDTIDRLLKEKDKIQNIVDLEEKLSSHDRIVYKMGQSLQTIHMLGKKPNKVYDPFLKAGLGYQNPKRLKKAIAAQPKMYDADMLHSDKLIIDSPDSEETLEDADESRIKMRNKMVQINYDKVIQLVLWIVDSRCSKHMAGNLQLLRNFVEKFMGTVRFGNDQFAAITGYIDYVQGNLTICHVYYVEGLGQYMLVGQFCDGDLECYNCNEKGHFARVYQKLKVCDAKYFREHMLLTMKDEAGSYLSNKENDLMLDNAYGEESLDELTAFVMLMARLQPADGNTDTMPSYDEKAVSQCVAHHALSRKSSVKRALFTSPLAAQSKNLGATPIVTKSRLSVAKTPTATSKVIPLVLWIVDSGCSKHMTSNLQLLRNFVEKFIGTIRFGNDHFAAIIGYRDYVQGNLMICHVYYVESPRHNLFLVGQFCNGDSEVAFHSSMCYVRNLEGNDFITGSRDSNLYTISMSEMVASSPVCLMSRATSTKSWLWYRQLSYLNFGTINQLTSNDMVDGLLKFKYNKDHLEYYATSSQEVSDDSAANTTDNDHTSSCSSIVVDQDDAPQIVSSSDEQVATAPNSPVMNEVADEFVQEDVADFDGNMFHDAPQTPEFEVAESSSTYQDPSNMHQFHQQHRSTDRWTKNHSLEQVIGDPSKPIETMQDELNQYKHLDVWELVKCLVGRNIIAVNGFGKTRLMLKTQLFGTSLIWLPKDTIKRRE